MNSSLKCAVIGCGYWGNHLVRNFVTSEQWNLKYICDIDESRLNKFSMMYPKITATAIYDFILNDEEIDAVVIATPANTHYELAMKALEAGKHVWVEKPLTSSSEQSLELIKKAAEKGLLLHVDHTFIYNRVASVRGTGYVYEGEG
jgi:predicted dehydrogenase